MSDPTETLRTSAPAVIVTGDMDLEVPRATGAAGVARSLYVTERVPLRNIARFTVISRDRLRFRVQLEHKWKEYTNLDGWKAELVDDQGRVYHPVAVDRTHPRLVTAMWDRQTVTAHRDERGSLVGVGHDAHLRRQTLGSMSMFRGGGDYVFYSRDIFTPATRALTLTLRRGDTTYEFTWKLEPEVVAAR